MQRQRQAPAVVWRLNVLDVAKAKVLDARADSWRVLCPGRWMLENAVWYYAVCLLTLVAHACVCCVRSL